MNAQCYHSSMLKLYNTLTRRKEVFAPLRKNQVGLYTCGPTVYDFAHIGNLRTYVFEDVLRRTLERFGYRVKHVTNITDVGHLVSDADTGEDKMQRALLREGLPPTVASLRQLADRYTQAFVADTAALNMLPPHAMPKATDFVPQMVAMVQKIVARGFAYETKLAVYFDVRRFPAYTALSGNPLDGNVVGARDDVEVDPDKRQAADFALWFKLAGKNKNHVMHWPSPWGEGFPGWHIECSAMSQAALGFPFDIHCGGIDHVNVHHANEIAQNEAFFGAQAVRWWMHGEFLDVANAKMAKSAGTFVRLSDVVARGFAPLDFRYLCLNTHYRQKLNFSWEALRAAAQALAKLRHAVREYRNLEMSKSRAIGCADFEQRFNDAVADDLNVPKALGVLWEMVGNTELPPTAQYASLIRFDEVLGLSLKEVKPFTIPADVQALVKQREQARQVKRWAAADALRREIEQRGYVVDDTPEGPKVMPKE